MVLALVVMLAASLAALVLPNRSWRSASTMLAATAGLVAFARLLVAFAVEDWRFAVVVDHTRPGLAWPLRLASAWAGAEGSLLLWAVLLTVVAVAVDRVSADRLGPALVAGLAAAYAIAVIVVANPFERLAAPPSEGLGLQPVLEHEAMTWHPPVLYAGLITALGAGAAGLGRASPVAGRRFWLLALALLTVGLATGARWAHVELGWGGYWAWDPIENAGLVVWLVAAAAVHRPADRAPAALVVIAVVWATTLTRTGLVASVHAFADDSLLRTALFIIAFATTAAVVALIARRRPDDAAEHDAPRIRRRRPEARAQALIVALVGAVIVALGTYEPLVEAAFGGDTVAIAGRYYSVMLWPVVVVGGLAATNIDRRPVAAGVGAVLGVAIVGPGPGVFAMMVGAAGGGVAGSALAVTGRSGKLAHVGLGLVLVGVAGTMGGGQTVVVADVDKPLAVAGLGRDLDLVHRELTLDEGRVTSTATATVDVDGTERHPSLVAYHLRSRSTAEMDELHRFGSLGGTTQVLLLDGDASQARYRLHWHPRIGLVWLGAALLALGSLGAARRSVGMRAAQTTNSA